MRKYWRLAWSFYQFFRILLLNLLVSNYRNIQYGLSRGNSGEVLFFLLLLILFGGFLSLKYSCYKCMTQLTSLLFWEERHCSILTVECSVGDAYQCVRVLSPSLQGASANTAAPTHTKFQPSWGKAQFIGVTLVVPSHSGEVQSRNRMLSSGLFLCCCKGGGQGRTNSKVVRHHGLLFFFLGHCPAVASPF